MRQPPLDSIRRPILAAAIVCLLATALAAQPGPDPGRPGPRYDKTTEMTVEGTVKEVRYPDDGRGRKGLHLTLEAGEETWDVHLGPAAYVETKGFSLAAGDAIVVTGSRVEIDGKPVLIARQLTKGDAKLELRDGEGRPLWARARR
jgi:hypothetical protein